MSHDTNKWLIILPIVIALPIAIVFSYNLMTRRSVLLFDSYLIANQTNLTTKSSCICPITNSSCNYSTTNSSYIHPMFKDPEAKACYSLKSLSMPEEIINLNAIAVGRGALNPSLAPKEVTFKQTHTILYGDPSSKSIYQYARKYFNKTYDRSYPHTNINAGEFNEIIKKLDPSLKLQFVIEVGSFTGNSAAIMGSVLKSAHPGSFLLCIDTWLGGIFNSNLIFYFGRVKKS
jgi:hypothetical protein